MMFEELDYQDTPLGELSLRRRTEPALGVEVVEIKLGDEFLMSSLFTASEIALARLGLDRCDGGALDIVVGGLGLGYTAQAVLEDPAVASMLVVEALGPVIGWHERGLLPIGRAVASDPRCRFAQGDFFKLAASADGFDPNAPGRKFDAILVDIDHSPEFLLHPENAGFYEADGLDSLMSHLKPGGVFGLWSNDPPDAGFTALLTRVFESAEAEPVVFENPLQNTEVTQTVYLARRTG